MPISTWPSDVMRSLSEGEAALLDQLGGQQIPRGPAPDIRSLLLGGVQSG